MCGFMRALMGGGERDTPPVVYSNPRADQEAADAVAASTAAQDRTRRRRSVRASSLLATGGDGDALGAGATPAAQGSATLGGR